MKGCHVRLVIYVVDADYAAIRLKQQLDLPPIEPRPPCPPKIYKKLYDYLNTTLLPLKRTRSAANAPTRPFPSRATPTKEKSLAQFRTATPTRTPSRANRTILKYEVPRDIPVWIAPVIRRLCKESQAPAAIPSVIAGVTSILTMPSPIPTERGKYAPGSEEEAAAALPEFKTPALIAMVYFFVKTKLLGKEIGGKDYGEGKKVALTILEKARQDEELKSAMAKKMTKDSDWMRDWEYISRKDIDTWLPEIAGKGWLELDWFANIQAGAGISGNTETEPGTPRKDKRRKIEPAEFLQAGLGTMMQDRVDFLTDKKRQEYEAWSQAVLQTISDMRKTQDVDVEMVDVV